MKRLSIILLGLWMACPLRAQPAAAPEIIVNLETPFRCVLPDARVQEISTAVAVQKNEFRLMLFDKTDALPRYNVRDFSISNTPIDEVLQSLVDEAGIRVFSEDGTYVPLNVANVSGLLSDVVKELTEVGDVFVRYNAADNELYVARNARFNLRLPDRTIMLAMLDALRGANIEAIMANWDENSLLMTLNLAQKKQVQALLDDILKNGYMVVANTSVYTLAPKLPAASWQRIVERFGVEKVFSANNGLIGKALTMPTRRRTSDFMKSLEKEFDIRLISQGVAVVPSMWKMRFDIGKCAISNVPNALSILLNAWVKSPKAIETTITLDAPGGEIASFNTISGIDNEIALIGVLADAATQAEAFVVLRLRLIHLLSERKA